ncbi:MAG: glycosyltransferase family 2 protein [Thermoleophilia bacterium]|nr:glycosyltransferase family 2 protein [Thermoleophilia bacterium]
MDESSVLIIIPAHNEADALAGVIGEVKSSLPAAGVVVVDDGSTDETPRIALESGAELLSLPYNLGIGSSMQTGFKLAAQKGYGIAVQVDGDGQHDPREVRLLLEPILRGECDMTVGSRYLEKNDYSGSAGRRLGTALFSRMLSLMVGQKLTDATSGFRAINRRLIEHFAHDYPRDYPEVEALMVAHMARCRIREIPVRMRQRGGGRSSINSFRSVYYMVKVLLALLVVATRGRAPKVS